MSKNPVVHFEMPYENKDRAALFYEQAFGWEMNKLGEDMGDYITAETAHTDENHMIKTPGSINGGFFPQRSDGPALVPSVVISVADINKAMADVKTAGGEVLGEPIEIAGICMYVSFTDTEGNRVSLLQPNPRG